MRTRPAQVEEGKDRNMQLDTQLEEGKDRNMQLDTQLEEGWRKGNIKMRTTIMAAGLRERDMPIARIGSEGATIIVTHRFATRKNQ